MSVEKLAVRPTCSQQFCNRLELAVSEALDKLAAVDRVEADLVKLRYFVGMTNDEAAAIPAVSLRTAKYYWTHARAWVYQEIAQQDRH